MGLNADAGLIWGIPIVAWDDDGEPTPFWSEEDEDWREFDGLKTVTYGHYEDPDNQRAILTSARMPEFSGDCWDPTAIDPLELGTEANADKAYSKAEDAARAAGLDVSFYAQARWWLVASFG